MRLESISPVTSKQVPDAGSWEQWCAGMYPADKDPANNYKCLNPSLMGRLAPPWTDFGAGARGLPVAASSSFGYGASATISQLLGGAAKAFMPPEAGGAGAEQRMRPETIALLTGGGIVALGLLALVAFRK